MKNKQGGFSHHNYHYNNNNNNINSTGNGSNLGIATLNREKICPFLLRVFIKEGSFHSPSEFSSRNVPEKDEIQIYTWRNATLKEITILIKETYKLARHKESKFEFAFIYPDSRGIYVSKPIGTVFSNKKSADDLITLDDLFFNYQFLDVSLSIPESSSSSISSPTSPSSPKI
ncbi:hypothetical protein DDB_G0285057 [Dictyostelium discoideum AX4]|uniref:Histone deacetylase complex subunit SAP18 n=1 Tax=Dictyostelium discoideum TaxID=44689 RepID=Q54NX4_DICDI|nr:hypothetical protein DDB_G0285057 [Dictyostelium discoideum AX4]EAL64992.1 hypothetical protein DDB_G0285057 [Dictyostelium discoideum AX4]|eukprot:XP_639943.1 hypothetical protein DDB_G0285057 [Dictyostelium discoideum AX4]